MNRNYPQLRILIPARGGSTRIKKKNLQEIIPGKSLLQWCVELYQAMLPGAPIVVATECHDTSKLAISLGCLLHGRRLEDINDTRDGHGILQDIIDCYPKSHILLAPCVAPFTFRSEVINALDTPKPFLCSAYTGPIYLASYGSMKSQDWPKQVMFSGNFMLARQMFTDSSVFYTDDAASSVSKLSMLDINTQDDLEHAQALAKVITPQFLLDH